MNASWYKVGSASDFPEGTLVERKLGHERILILHRSNRWYAFQALCPHVSQPLHDCPVTGSILECIWHNMTFDLETGAVINDSGFIGIPGLKIFEVKIEGKNVFVRSFD